MPPEDTPHLGTAPACCPLFHEAIELIGRRWTGAIVEVLLQRGSCRFKEISHAVPQLSDRLLSERLKELEYRGVVSRDVAPGPPLQVAYELTPMGRQLEPVVTALKVWARRWLAEEAGVTAGRSRPALDRGERTGPGRTGPLA